MKTSLGPTPPVPGARAAKRLLAEIEPLAEALRAGRAPDMEATAWPEGLDRSFLSLLPLGARPLNCLLGAGLDEGAGRLTAGTLLGIRNMGTGSLSAVVLGLEDFLRSCAAPAPPSGGAWGHLRTTWARAVNGGVAHPAPAADSAVGGRELALRIARRLDAAFAGASDRDLAIVDLRIVQDPPATLRRTGKDAWLTRERVRQVQKTLEERIDRALGGEVEPLAVHVADGLPPALPEAALDKRLLDLRFGGSKRTFAIIRREIVKAMGRTIDQGMCLNAEARSALAGVRPLVRAMGDEAGLVDERELRAAFDAQAPSFKPHWAWVRKRCGLQRVRGCVTLRLSMKARVMASLRALGKPSGKDEIGRLCGLTEPQVGSVLSSLDSVARADPKRWGLREWIEDEYAGIAGEIAQRIRDGGGSASAEDLVEDLPTRFGVDRSSVLLYLKAPRFRMEDGKVRLAGPEEIRLRPLDEAIHGRDGQGRPFWTFRAMPRHLVGHSATGFPAELAQALGCEPDEGIAVRLRGVPGAERVTVRWPLSSTYQCTVGHLAQPLKTLGIASGERVRLTVTAPGVLTLAKEAQGASP